MKLTTAIIMAGAACSSAVASTWLAPLQTACGQFDITTPQRVAAFLANVGVESEGLTVFSENLNYSAQGLANTWKTRYAENPHGEAPFVPNQTAYELARKPQAIANNVYGGRMGNGPESSGDGWNYRGQGPIQLTGKTNILACMMAIDEDLVNHPELLQQPEAGALSAAWFFATNGCNDLADAGNINGVVERINGQAPCPANKGDVRLANYGACLKLCLASAPVPAAPAVKAPAKAPAAAAK